MVVDHILHDSFTKEDCLKVLQGYPTNFVGVHCPLEELEGREKIRGDRNLGLARKQLEFVHRGVAYDMEVNTYLDSVSKNAKKIIGFLK